MPATGGRLPAIPLIVLWSILLVASFFAPRLLGDDDPADVVTRQTARVAVLYWWFATAGLLLGRNNDARWLWTLACAGFAVHVAAAFDYVHHWSHTAAFAHVEQVSGFGPGIYVSYLFGLIWLADVIWWWADPNGYVSRSKWLDRGIHGFMTFVVFNGTVVYETGFIRWAGIVMFVVLGMLAVLHFWRPGIGIKN